MPLIISESSQCDVCLNNFDWTHPIEDERVVPGVIPCGHVLCISCLRTISPPVCPFCRGRYAPDRIKKIHVDGVDENEKHDLDLLKQLFSNALDGFKNPVPSQILTRLEGERGPSIIPLKDAHAIFTQYNDLWRWYSEHEPRYEHYKAEYERLSRANPSPGPAPPSLKPAEYPLVGVAPQTQSGKPSSKSRTIAELRNKIHELEAELAPIRIAQNQERNPLPKPPEHVPYSQIPSLMQYLNKPQPAAGSSPGTFGQRIINDNSPPQKSRSHRNGERRVPINPYADPPTPQASSSRSDAVVRGSKRGVIPGATPEDRFIPPAPSYEDRLGHASTFVNAYGQGMHEGYNLASGSGPSNLGEARTAVYTANNTLPESAYHKVGHRSNPASSKPNNVRRTTVQVDEPLTPRVLERHSLASENSLATHSVSSWGTAQSSSLASSLHLATFGDASLPPTWPPLSSETSIVPVPFAANVPHVYEARSSVERLRVTINEPTSSSTSSRESLTGSVHGTSSERNSRRHRSHRSTASAIANEIQTDSESRAPASHSHRSGNQISRATIREADTSNLVVGNPRYNAFASAPSNNSVSSTENALGLAIDQPDQQQSSAQIAAPTPRSSSQPFLRAYSEGLLASNQGASI